jgi:chromosome partitioning protein
MELGTDLAAGGDTAAKVITVATGKGGAGKTTLARLILGRMAMAGHRLAAIDADYNENLATWVTDIGKLPITVRKERDETKIVPTVNELQDDHALIVIDTAGAALQATVFAIGCSDLVLVPVKPGSDDVIAAIKTFAMLKSASQMLRREIPAAVVMIGFKPNTVIEEHLHKEMVQAGLPVLNSRLTDLTRFPEMSLTGQVPIVGGAGVQVTDLINEIDVFGVLPHPLHPPKPEQRKVA